MALISSTKDARRRSLTLVSELDATADRAWSLWSAPSRFARWWGPPGLPLIVDDHDLSVGGAVRFDQGLAASIGQAQDTLVDR